MTRSLLSFAIVMALVGINGVARADLLGTAETFGVLGGSTVTSTGLTSIVGDLGVSPGLAITGFGPGVVTGGTIHVNDAVAVQAHADAATAYALLASIPVDHTLTGTDLGGLTLTPGVYFFSSSAQLTGTLTLDGQGQADPRFVFQIGSTLTTASSAMILLTDGANSGNVFFQVGSSATLGTDTQFAGTIIAFAAATLTHGTNVDGRVIALTEGVTMDTNNVTIPVRAVPEPPAIFLFGAGLMSIVVYKTRIRIAA